MRKGRQCSVQHLDHLKHRRSLIKGGKITNPISVTTRDIELLLNVSVIKKIRTCIATHEEDNHKPI